MASRPRAERCGRPNRRSATASKSSRAISACRLLNRTSRKFGMTDAGEDFYRHAVAMLREAELAENAVRASAERAERHNTVHGRRGDHAVRHDRTSSADFLIRYPKVNIVVHAIDRAVDIVGENFDIAIRAHSGPLPDSNLVQRTLAPAPWFLFAGSDYLAANGEPQKPQDLRDHPSLFMMRTGVDPVWRLRPARQAKQAKNEVVDAADPEAVERRRDRAQEAAIKGLGSWRCPVTSAARRSNPERCDGCCRTGSPATPRLPRSFRTGRDCYRRSGPFSIIWSAELPKAVLM